MVLPPSARVDLEISSVTPGISGYVECLTSALALGGLNFSADELICVSSAAFARYVFDPKMNQHEAEPRRFSALGELFSNYGVFESLGYYTGWRIAELNELSDVDFWKLVRFELASGRPMVSLGFGALHPVLLVGYREEKGQRWVEVIRDSGREELDFSAIRRPQGDSEVFVNFVVIVRESESPDWAATKNRQRMGVLHWAVKHSRSRKEFLHETRENYAPGKSGGEVIADALETLGQDSELDAYLAAHVREQRRSRGAAARVLAGWGDDLAADVDAPDVARLLALAADEFGKAVALLELDAKSYREFIAHEQAALGYIEEASQHFPNAFG